VPSFPLSKVIIADNDRKTAIKRKSFGQKAEVSGTVGLGRNGEGETDGD
jgi:hypothetical protein